MILGDNLIFPAGGCLCCLIWTCVHGVKMVDYIFCGVCFEYNLCKK
jgi:hypothetical protein